MNLFLRIFSRLLPVVTVDGKQLDPQLRALLFLVNRRRPLEAYPPKEARAQALSAQKLVPKPLVKLHAVEDLQAREGLERLCRYVLRPPLAKTRLHRRPDGLLVLTLRKPYANGTSDFIFSEVELAQKLAALVPPNRKKGVTYHGVLAPRHRLRNQVIPEPPETEPRERLCKTPAKGKSRWHAWADLLWRVFEIDGLACVCGGGLTLHAVVRPPATIDVLRSLERSAQRQARGPPLPQLASA